MTSRLLTRSVAAALAAGALAAPAANAMPDFPLTPPKSTPSTAGAAAPEPVSVPGPTIVVEADERSGFDWGSAGIGAGAGIAVLLLTAAAATTGARHGRMRPTGG